VTFGTDVAIWGAGIVATIVGSHVRLETRFNDHMRQSNARIKQVEQRVGIAPANGVRCEFVTNGTCEMMHEASAREASQTKAELLRGMGELKEQVAEVRQTLMDRSHPET